LVCAAGQVGKSLSAASHFQRAVASGVIAPVMIGAASALFSMTTVHSSPDLSRQLVSSRLRALAMSVGLAAQ